MRLLIVNFHYIRDDKPLSGIYPVSTGEFRRQVEVLGKLYRFVSQDQLIEMMRADSYPSGDYCLITFDDGFKEQWMALDILRQMSVPAVCFATTQPVMDNTAHDVHKMHYVYSKFDDVELFALLTERFQIDTYKFDDALLAEEYRYDSWAKKKVKFFINFVLDGCKRHDIVNYLFSQIEPNESAFVGRFYMDRHDIQRLADEGMLGTHTKTHRPLAPLDGDAMREEIAGSRMILEDLTGTPVRSISYPFGGPAAVSLAVANAARREGMLYGLTMIRGINDDETIRDGMMLRRVDTNDAPGGKSRSQQYFP